MNNRRTATKTKRIQAKDPGEREILNAVEGIIQEVFEEVDQYIEAAAKQASQRQRKFKS